MPHLKIKNADILIHWANGGDIQYNFSEDWAWRDYLSNEPPRVNDSHSIMWRIKPDVQVRYYLVDYHGVRPTSAESQKCNLKLTIEDGKLIKAELIGVNGQLASPTRE